MKVENRELTIEFSIDEPAEFQVRGHACQASRLVLKYHYASDRKEPYWFSAHVSGVYECNGYPAVGKRTFNNDSKDLPSWVFLIALEQAPGWFAND